MLSSNIDPTASAETYFGSNSYLYKYRGYQREIDPPRDLDTIYFNRIILSSEEALEVHPSSNRSANLRDQIARLISDSIHITENDMSIVIEGVFKVLDDPVPGIPILAVVAEVTLQIVDDFDAVFATESLITLPGLISASKSSIEGLEKVGLHSLERNSIIQETASCVICMEDFDYSAEEEVEDEEEEGGVVDIKRRGLMITRMPCLHCYHEDCIVRWLEMTHWCPICRYRMPTGHQNLIPNKGARLH